MKTRSVVTGPMAHLSLKDKVVHVLMRDRVSKDYISFFFDCQNSGSLSGTPFDLQ